MNTTSRLVVLLFSPCLISLGHAAILFTSDFDGNTGATVLPGNTDNTSGSSTVTINDWSTDPAVTAISGLTAISTSSGGFAQLQNGSAKYADADNIYISRNLNLDTNPRRGFSMTFNLSGIWDLTNITVLSGHTNNQGTQDQAYSSDLVFSLSGGTLESAIVASSREDYSIAPDYHSVSFDLSGNTIGAGTYTVEVYQTNLSSGGAYATFDGITLTAVPEPSTSLVAALAGLSLALRRRR